MYIYKTLINENTIPNSTQRAGPDNVIVGDIVKFKNKKKEIKYAVVNKIGKTMLNIRDLFFIDNKNFNLDDNHSEKNSPHKGALNYNYLRPKSNARYIEIVDRSQFKIEESINNDNVIIDAEDEMDSENIYINYKEIDYILEDGDLYEIKKIKGKKYKSLENIIQP